MQVARRSFTTTIDEDLQKAFKISCTEKNDKMNDVLEAFMQSYINDEFGLEREIKFSLKKKK